MSNFNKFFFSKNLFKDLDIISRHYFLNNSYKKESYKNYLYYKLHFFSKLEFLQSSIFKKKDFNKINDFFENKFTADIFTFDRKNKKFSISINFFLRQIFIILMNTISINFKIFFSLLNKKNKKKVSIIYKNLARQKQFTSKNVKTYFDVKKRHKLGIGKELILISTNEKYSSKEIIFSKNPVTFLALNYFSFHEKLILMWNIIFEFLHVLKKICFEKNDILFENNFADRLIMEKVDSLKIINKILLFHTSVFSDLRLWQFSNYKNFNITYVYDSLANFYPLQSKNMIGFKYGSIKKLIFNEYITSNNYSKKFLKKINKKAKIKVFKSIGINIGSPKIKLNNNFFNIGIFDHNIERVLQPNNLAKYVDFQMYYNLETKKNFVAEILEEINSIYKNKKINIRCYLKEKPELFETKSKNEYFKKLEKKYSFFKILKDNADVEYILPQLDTVICAPFSSVLFQFLNFKRRKSYFYNINNLLNNNFKDKQICLINKSNLKKNILSDISKYKKKN